MPGIDVGIDVDTIATDKDVSPLDCFDALKHSGNFVDHHWSEDE